MTEQIVLQAHSAGPASTWKPFEPLTYTRRKIVGHLGLIEEHCTDGSAFENCQCIEEKHLIKLGAFASEGATIAQDVKEKEFYAWLAPWADKTLDRVLEILDRNNDAEELAMWSQLADDCSEIRHQIQHRTFEIPNPTSTRKYLPHGLTVEEKQSKHLQQVLSRCINKVEQRCCKKHSAILYKDGAADYSQCSCNPVAVCRSTVKA
jgi:hypothetical protein